MKTWIGMGDSSLPVGKFKLIWKFLKYVFKICKFKCKTNYFWREMYLTADSIWNLKFRSGSLRAKWILRCSFNVWTTKWIKGSGFTTTLESNYEIKGLKILYYSINQKLLKILTQNYAWCAIWTRQNTYSH